MLRQLDKKGGGWSKLPALLAVMALVVAACGGGDEAATTVEDTTTTAEEVAGNFGIDLTGVEIRMTTPPASTLQMPQYLLADQLQEWGAEVDLITITSITGVGALIADQADIAPHGADELILASAEGAVVTAVGIPMSRLTYVLIAKKEYGGIDELEGKRIGMSGPAGFDALLTRFALRDVGLDPEADVNFVQIGGSPDRATALLAGQIDAATVFIDNWIELKGQTDDLVLLKSMAETVPNIPGSAYMGLADYWSENIDVAFAVACGNLEVNKFIRENRQAFIDYTLENVEGASREAVEVTYDFAQEINMWPGTPEEIMSDEGLDELMQAMLETGDISAEVDTTTLSASNYLIDAYDRGCGK